MKEIIIKTQAELDNLKRVEKDEFVIIENSLRLNSILEVYGELRIRVSLDCHWNERFIRARGNSNVTAWGNSTVAAWGNSTVEARENSSVTARENSSVTALENSNVTARGNSTVAAWGNSTVAAWGNSTVEARENSTVAAWENSNVTALENSNVTAWENSTVAAWENSNVTALENSTVAALENSNVTARENSNVTARGNSTVAAWGNSTVEARENSSVRGFSEKAKAILYGFSVLFLPISINMEFEVKSKHAHVQRISQLDWFENNGIEKNKEVVLFKRVSHDFKTQEGTNNETLWEIGSVVEHPNWNPQKEECGAGKFHACSRPYFCDEFRKMKGDRYIAIKIALDDLHEWKDNPSYPHKIGFRKGKVLYECDRFGQEKKS